jgi:Ca2+-binding RTX toxin-like protein
MLSVPSLGGLAAALLVLALPASVSARTVFVNDAAIVGTPEVDVFCGLSGDDEFAGMDGNDALFGDDCAFALSLDAPIPPSLGGDDDLSGGKDDDLLVGEWEDDVLSGGRGDDKVSGGAGDDRLFGGAEDDRLLGGVGDDSIAPGGGSDSVDAGGGNDSIRSVDDDADLVLCGRGQDAVRADRADRLRGCEEVRRSRR